MKNNKTAAKETASTTHNGLRNETMWKPNFKLAEICLLMAY